MSTVPPQASASTYSPSIASPAVETILKACGHLAPADCVRLSATCRALAGFCSRQAATAKQLLQHAGSLLEPHDRLQHQQHLKQRTPQQTEGLQLRHGCVMKAAAQLALTDIDQLVTALLFNTAQVPLQSAVVLVAAGLWAGSPQLAAAAARGVKGCEVWYIAQQWLMAVDALERIQDLPLLQNYLKATPLNWLQCCGQYLTESMRQEAIQLSPTALASLLHLALRLQAQPLFQLEPDTIVDDYGVRHHRRTVFAVVLAEVMRHSVAVRHLGSADVLQLLMTAVSVACSPSLDLHQPHAGDILDSKQEPRTIVVTHHQDTQVFRCLDSSCHSFGAIVSCLWSLLYPYARYVDRGCTQSLWLALAQGLDALAQMQMRGYDIQPQPLRWWRWSFIARFCTSWVFHFDRFVLHTQPGTVATLLRYKIATDSFQDVMHLQYLVKEAIAAGTMQMVSKHDVHSLIDAAKAAYMPCFDGELAAGLYSVKGLRSLLWYARLKQAVLNTVQHHLSPQSVVYTCCRILEVRLHEYFTHQQVAELADMLHGTFVAPKMHCPGWRGMWFRFSYALFLAVFRTTAGLLERVLVDAALGAFGPLLEVAIFCCYIK